MTWRFCGLGLALLGEETNAIKIYELLQKTMVDDYAWGIYLSAKEPNILQTFYATMFYERLHKECRTPHFIKEFLRKKDDNGISFTRNGEKYVEALTCVTYMYKNYYHEAVTEQCQVTINNYYRQKYDAIINGNEDNFELHQGTNWRIYLFGVAAYAVQNLKNHFYIRNNHYILEALEDRFTEKTSTNIPYVLELCELYNAIKGRLDPFNNELVIEEIKNLETEIESLKIQIHKMEDNHRSTILKVPLATVLFIIYAGLVAIIGYGIILWITEQFLTEKSGLITLVNVGGAIVSTMLPLMLFFTEKVRKLFLFFVNRLFKKLDMVDKI